MVFQAQVASHPIRVEEGLDVVVISVVTQIAVKFAVGRITGVADLGAPDAARTLRIATEGRNPGRSIDRSIDAITRTRLAVVDAVGIGEEVAQPGIAQQLFHSGDEAAFREPDALRLAPEVGLVAGGRDLDLGPTRFVRQHQRQEAMGGGAGDRLDHSGVHQLDHPVQQIAVEAFHHRQAVAQVVAVHHRRFGERRMLLGRDFLFGEFEQP